MDFFYRIKVKIGEFQATVEVRAREGSEVLALCLPRSQGMTSHASTRGFIFDYALLHN